PLELRGTDGLAATVAAGAVVLDEEPLAFRGHRRSRPSLGEPALEFSGLHDRDPANHGRVIRAAIFGAVEVIAPDSRRLEPKRRVTTRQHILFHAECGDEEAVDHVLR